MGCNDSSLYMLCNYDFTHSQVFFLHEKAHMSVTSMSFHVVYIVNSSITQPDIVVVIICGSTVV